MGCTPSMYAGGRKKMSVPEVSIFLPSMRRPSQSQSQLLLLPALLPDDLPHRITSLRNHISSIAQYNSGESSIKELQQALVEYLSLVLGLTNKEHGLQDSVEFKWQNLEDEREEICIANPWFELLSVIHMMTILTLREANLKLIPKDSNSSRGRVVSANCMRESVDLFLKVAGFLDFCIHKVLVHLPPDLKLPKDLQKGVLEAISNQALAQGTQVQLGLALQSESATLSVKRRIACELLTYLGKARNCVTEGDISNYKDGKKHLCFIKWKYLEAKAAAYYYHGLVLDKGTKQSCHVSGLCCFLASKELLAESNKACISFCLAEPVTRAPPPWGAMKHLHKKIPETALKKTQMYGYILDKEKGLQVLPDLPEFELSLIPEDYPLPEIDSAWGSEISLDIPIKESEDGYELLIKRLSASSLVT